MTHFLTTKALSVILPRHDFWQSITDTGNDLIGKLKGLAPIGIALAMIGVGCMFMYSNKTRDGAKSSLPHIIFGAICIFGAVAFATYLQNAAKF